MQPHRLRPSPFTGLSLKLIAMIVVVILIVEIAVYLPSLASYRANWLEDRLRVGAVAVRVFDTVPDIMDLPAEISDPLLESAGAVAIAYRREGQSDLITLDAADMPSQANTADTREMNPMGMIGAALDTMVSGRGRMLRIVGELPGTGDTVVEVILAEDQLRADMLVYSRNILVLSLVIAGLTALVLYIVAQRLLIGPIQRLSRNVLAFRQSPENGALTIAPDSPRRDEIGVLEHELVEMQQDIYAMLRQRRHLAELGLAVAKINHDLRNMLASAQMLSDQVATLDDPKVHRLAPRLVSTLDRAISFAQTVIDYGKQRDVPPRPEPLDLRALGTECAAAAGLMGHPSVRFDNDLDDDLVITIDPDHLSRVLTNLFKNAREALEGLEEAQGASITLSAQQSAQGLRVLVRDNGPGLPERAKENLFVAFQGAGRAGGTGLGLAIARELTEANGGTLSLLESESGTTFALDFPPSMRA